jgi:hypothetical protein
MNKLEQILKSCPMAAFVNGSVEPSGSATS